jgi:riboflavin synthase
MFTGLVESVGIISSLQNLKGGLKLSIKPQCDMELHTGDSLAVNGVCLTAVKTGKELACEVSPETIRNTTFGALRVNEKVNLERPLRLTDRLGGHIVTGHVDGVGLITDKRQEGEYTLYTFEVSPEFIKYVVRKGSIAIDGISLTVTDLSTKSFGVAIIPHTLKVTNIGDKGIGSKVNLEADIIGKYVENFMHKTGTNTDLINLLKEQGFRE